jgi:hypothetical protein
MTTLSDSQGNWMTLDYDGIMTSRSQGLEWAIAYKYNDPIMQACFFGEEDLEIIECVEKEDPSLIVWLA